jgi:hypothetical protein
MLGKVLRHHCLVKLAAEFGYVVFKCGILCLQLSDLLFENLREEALVPVLGFSPTFSTRGENSRFFGENGPRRRIKWTSGSPEAL